MRKIKIVKIFNTERYDYENTEVNTIVAEGIDWHEVDDVRFAELHRLITFANQHRYQMNEDYILQMIEEISPMTVEVYLEKAKKLLEELEEKQRKQKEKDEKARLAKNEKRRVTDMERKRKQLEKLQKELSGEDNIWPDL